MGWSAVGWSAVGWSAVGWSAVGWSAVGWSAVGWSAVGTGTGDRPGTGDRHRRPPRHRRPATGDRRPATGDRRPATGDRRPATGDRRPATGDRRPATGTGTGTGRGCGSPPEVLHGPTAHRSGAGENEENVMKIKLTNTEKLRTALAAVNGAASAHTASAWDVARQAGLAEAHLDALGIAKKDRRGAVRDYVSGERVSNAYSKKNWSGRAATRVRLTRGASGWFVTAIERVTIGQSGGWARTLLTPDQRDLALTVFRAGFGVLPVPVLPVLPVPVAA